MGKFGEYGFSSVVAFGSLAFGFLFGEWSVPLSALALMMSLDFILGLVKGVHFGNLNSKVGYKGIAKKFGILIVLIIAHQADKLTGNGDMFFMMATYFYIAMESISIFENLSLLGVPVPEKLKQYFEQLPNEKENNK